MFRHMMPSGKCKRLWEKCVELSPYLPNQHSETYSMLMIFETQLHVYVDSQHFHQLSIEFSQDFANPEIAKHLHFYPEEVEASRPIGEVWQADRWKEFKPSELTPMYARGLRQFYIDELCELRDGRYMIPHDWVIRKKKLTACCSLVEVSDVGQHFIILS
jgi:hypothetical protein